MENHGLIARAHSLPFSRLTSSRFLFPLPSECHRGQRIAAACQRFVGGRCFSGQQPGGKGSGAFDSKENSVLPRQLAASLPLSENEFRDSSVDGIHGLSGCSECWCRDT